MGEVRYGKVMVGNMEGKKPLGSTRHRCEYNIKSSLKKGGGGFVRI
jgi:hypothetical protein